MKRIIASIVIITVIVTLGCVAIFCINRENTRLYGVINEVTNSQSYEEAAEAVEELQRAFDRYERKLSCIVDEDILEQMSSAVSMLAPMLESGSDEFTAQCELVRSYAKRLLDREIPTISRVL